MSHQKKHHYRPEFYLKGFSHAPTGKAHQLWCLDKKKGNLYLTSVSDLCAEGDFFSFDEEGLAISEKLSLENALSKTEFKVESILTLIRSNQTLACVSPADFHYLLEWIAWLFVAKPINKLTLNTIKQLYLEDPDAYFTNSQHIYSFFNGYEKVLPFFLNRGWHLGVLTLEDGEFITSDCSIHLMGKSLFHPVGVENALSIYFPISPNLILAGTSGEAGFESKPKKIPKEMLKHIVDHSNMVTYGKATRFVISKSEEPLRELYNVYKDIAISSESTLEAEGSIIKIVGR